MWLEDVASLEMALIIWTCIVLGTITGFSLDKYKNRQTRFGSSHKDPGPVKSAGMLKAELQSLEFEKSLAEEAIARVQEAIKNGLINDVEYDRLISQYKQKLCYYSDRIAELKTATGLLQVQDLRNDLIYVLEKRIKEIDQRLTQLSSST